MTLSGRILLLLILLIAGWLLYDALRPSSDDTEPSVEAAGPSSEDGYFVLVDEERWTEEELADAGAFDALVDTVKAAREARGDDVKVLIVSSPAQPWSSVHALMQRLSEVGITKVQVAITGSGQDPHTD